MLLRLSRADDLLGVLGVRRAEHHALHLRIAQRVVQVLRERDSLRLRELHRVWRRIGDTDYTQPGARLCERDNDAAPPAEADDSDVERSRGHGGYFARLALVSASSKRSEARAERKRSTPGTRHQRAARRMPPSPGRGSAPGSRWAGSPA